MHAKSDHQTNGTEVERKFILREIPEHLSGPGIPVMQGYLSAQGAALEVRLRLMGRHRFLTVKSGTGLVRGEREVRISRRAFESLWPLTEGARVEKTRFRARRDGLTTDVDLYHGALEPLVTAEVEAPRGVSAASLDLPDWLGNEVTGLTGYANRELAHAGLPQGFEALRPEQPGAETRPLTHAGAIPYRVEKGRLQVMCVTSKSRKRWIVPKGIWEAEDSLRETAVKESWEEGGVSGTLSDGALGIVEDIRPDRVDRILMFALRVNSEDDEWPESSERKRRWLSLDDAVDIVSMESLSGLLKVLAERFR